jgi:hypothetical protein
MMVKIPIVIVPGSEEVDTGLLDWDSNLPDCSVNWYCGTCSAHHFPMDNVKDEHDPPTKEELEEELEMSICGGSPMSEAHIREVMAGREKPDAWLMDNVIDMRGED